MQTVFEKIAVRFGRAWDAIAASKFATVYLPPAVATARDYAQLMRLHKPIGTLLLLWPALWALWLASNGRPDQHVFAVFLVGVFLTRSAGCAINDYADRNFDAHVKRTKDRPLADRRIEPREALLVFVCLSLMAVGLAFTLNTLAQQMALVGAVMIVTYPFFKRFFPAPQLYLGIAFAWSIPMAYAAQAGHMPRLAWLLFIAGILWTAAYDTMYGMVDRDDDLKIGIKSTAILFGSADRAMTALMQLMCLLALALAGVDLELGPWYWIGLCVAAVLAIYQQILIKNREPESCLRAFLNNNYFGMAVFIGIALDQTFRY
jgi:4-hydroxybenzoate polyprenyltransferase